MQQPPNQPPYNQPQQPYYPQQPSQPLMPGQYAPPPQYQPPQPPQKKPGAMDWYRKQPRGTRIALPIILVVLFIILVNVVNAGSSSISAQRSANATAAAATTAAQPTAKPATPTPKPSPTPTPKPKSWTTTHTYTGNGTGKTDTFTIKGDHWKLAWSCDPTSFYGGSYNVIVDVDSPGQSFPVDSGAVNTICKDGNASGGTEEYQSGTFYIAVNSEAVWIVTIQELQ